MADRRAIRKDGKLVYTEATTFDPSPYYACEVTEVKDSDGNVLGKAVLNWMAFDPKYGPDDQEQIDWHIAHGTPGAAKWKVGEPTA
jgi:hypothetical protein